MPRFYNLISFSIFFTFFSFSFPSSFSSPSFSSPSFSSPSLSSPSFSSPSFSSPSFSFPSFSSPSRSLQSPYKIAFSGSEDSQELKTCRTIYHVIKPGVLIALFA